MTIQSLGMYVHIPFCSFCCHYCDFAKTARFDDALVNRYFQCLEEEVATWVRDYLEPHSAQLTSLYFGGGTPGLFTDQYRRIFDRVRPFLVPDAEVTLEVNPRNCSADRLQFWAELGFNRVSIGIQSFDADGLRKLTRDHSRDEAIQACRAARSVFSATNIDLIYGWPGQSDDQWFADLAVVADLDPNHLSLYCLEYAAATPFGRAYQRGKIAGLSDDTLYRRFRVAQKWAQSQGFKQEEVSNWARPGFECRHNRLYWQDRSFLACGLGSWGYLEDDERIGIRFHAPNRLKPYLDGDHARLPGQVGSHWQVEDRSTQDWLLEYLGAALRSDEGIEISRVERKARVKWYPGRAVLEAVEHGQLRIVDGRVYLASSEYFRETAWCQTVAEGFGV